MRSLTSLLFVTLATSVLAQTPTRDRAVADTGTASISGTVVDAETGKPVHRANVTTMFAANPRSTLSGADGRFVLSELPAGKISLTAVKFGYLAAVGPGSANPRQRIPSIELAQGQAVQNVVLRVTRGGVISGRVVDNHGDPVDGAQVRPYRFLYLDGERKLSEILPGSVMTDDQGVFRLFGLQPGDVYVGVLPGFEYSGYALAASAEGPIQTFYPGTNSPAEAKPIAVRAGRETGGIVLPLSIARLSRVTGRVVSATTEQFFNWSVVVSPSDPLSAGSFGFSGIVRPDGTFEVKNLPPGTYGLEARASSWPAPPPRSEVEIARTLVTVSGEDLADVMLSTARAGIVRGRIAMDDGSPPPFAPGAIRVNTGPTDRKSVFRGYGQPPAVNEDWTFEMVGLLGSVRVGAGPIGGGFPPPPWAFKAVVLDNRDVTDEGIELAAGATIEGVRIVFTRKPTRLTGKLDPAANPQATWILVFASDESRWRVPSRYVLAARSNSDGEYAVELVANQEYLIAAVDDIEDGQWSDLELLRAVRHRATLLTLADGETRSHDLTIVDWRR